MAKWVGTHPTFVNKTDLSAIVVNAVSDLTGVFAASLEGVSVAMDGIDITELRDLSLMRWNTAYVVNLDAHDGGADVVVTAGLEDTVQQAVNSAFVGWVIGQSDAIEAPRGVRAITVSLRADLFHDVDSDALTSGATDKVMPALRQLAENLSTHYFTQVRR
jgi:hypothetical protein